MSISCVWIPEELPGSIPGPARLFDFPIPGIMRCSRGLGDLWESASWEAMPDLGLGQEISSLAMEIWWDWLE